MGKALLASLLALLVSLVHAGSFSSTYIKALSGSDFKKEVFGTERATIAVFYAPWCGHCQRLAPEYEKAAKNLAGMVDFVAVDCDEDKNKPLCQEYGIRGFPTIKTFSSPSKATAKDYNGERTASALVQAATREMPSFSKRIKSASELGKIISKVPKKPVVFLLTDKIATSSLYKALSTDFHKTYSFYTVKDDAEFDPIKKNFGITKVPSLILWKGEDQVEIFGGTLKLGHISHWLKQAAKPKGKADAAAKNEKKKQEPAATTADKTKDEL